MCGLIQPRMLEGPAQHRHQVFVEHWVARFIDSGKRDQSQYLCRHNLFVRNLGKHDDWAIGFLVDKKIRLRRTMFVQPDVGRSL